MIAISRLIADLVIGLHILGAAVMIAPAPRLVCASPSDNPGIRATRRHSHRCSLNPHLSSVCERPRRRRSPVGPAADRAKSGVRQQPAGAAYRSSLPARRRDRPAGDQRRPRSATEEIGHLYLILRYSRRPVPS